MIIFIYQVDKERKKYFSNKIINTKNTLGDILLGGFFPIHQPPSNEYGSNQCTAIKRERGIQRLEAMLFALDVVNNRSSYFNSSLYNKYKLNFGALIYDSCDYESYAIERAFNMLLPSLKQCTSSKRINQSSLVVGVIGSASSTVSMAIADILRLAEVVLIFKEKNNEIDTSV
jgi:hypothetical protein